MGKTKIDWADKVWNPVTGCTKVSEGCRHCYAERMAKRLAGRYGYPEAPDQFKVTLHPDKLDEPLHWKKPARIFVDSMGDLFHEDVPDEFLPLVWANMAVAKWHKFIILTKRPDRTCEVLSDGIFHEAVAETIEEIASRIDPCIAWSADEFFDKGGILTNVWLLTSVENQKTADERIPWLLKTPAAKRGISVEPMLEKIDLKLFDSIYVDGQQRYKADLLDWVICGGETGPRARPLQPEWVEDLLNQCQVAAPCLEEGIPFFFKQWGEWSDAMVIEGKHTMTRIGRNKAGRYLCGRTWDEYPEVEEK